MHGTARRRCLDDSKQNPTPQLDSLNATAQGALLSPINLLLTDSISSAVHKGALIELLQPDLLRLALVLSASWENQGSSHR